ncbi:MAG: 1-phosphofructokinase family hexose kinase [Marmoricola sp.]
MIVTLTPNPSVDRTVILGGPLVPGAVHRVAGTGAQAAGKGVNISRAATTLGLPTIAVLPVADDDPYVAELRAAGIACHTVAPDGPVRTNLTLTSPDGTTTKLNSSGPEMSPRLRGELTAAVGSLAGAPWIVLAGSLPPGCPATWYAELVALLHDAPGQVAVDTSDAPLQALAAAPALPDLMKPNDTELASLTGADPTRLATDPGAAATAARLLVEKGAGAVLATLGGAGAVLVTSAGAWHATPPPITVASTVGAGDCSLFGYIAADLRGAGPAERLAHAVAWGSAAAALPGTTIPQPGQIRPELVHVRELELVTTEGDTRWEH